MWEMTKMVKKNEARIRTDVVRRFDEYNAELEYAISDGFIDILLPDYNVVIECKDMADLTPLKKGSGSKNNESAFEQLERYVQYMRMKSAQQKLFVNTHNKTWYGIITNNHVWYMWEWPTLRSESSSVKIWDGFKTDDVPFHILTNRDGGSAPPSDILSIFKPYLDKLKTTYVSESGKRHVKTQQSLWKRQLNASGMSFDNDELYLKHVMLISISRYISESIGMEKEPGGFAAWVDGTDWAILVKSLVCKYDWKKAVGDVMRDLHHGLISANDRHRYGEYYTPDWLADMLVNEIIDDKYIKTQLENFLNNDPVHGILDPACGSGTFLHYAIRHILESQSLKSARLSKTKITSFLIDLICGIDIHPVAVEMARVNILRSLPTIPDSPIRLYQSDSLRIQRSAMFDNLDNLAIYSNKKTPITFPKIFLESSEFNNDIRRIVDAAVSEENLIPIGIGKNLNTKNKSMLNTAFNTFKHICREEGNGVWAWYIMQMAGPYLIQRRKVGRILSNPPWVLMRSITNETRKDEMKSAAKKAELWTGGNNATAFDIAALFVDHCMKLYLLDDGKSAWILPDGFKNGRSWKRYRDKHKPNQIFDLGEIPFPDQGGAYVNVFGDVPKKIKKLIKGDDGNFLLQRISKNISEKLESKDSTLPDNQSEWIHNRKPLARQGATFVPDCLIRVNDLNIIGDRAHFTTKNKLWHGVKQQHSDVPKSWIHNVIYPDNLLPYHIRDSTKLILPLDNTDFDKSRHDEQYWRDATDLYEKNKSSSSVPTLELNLNYSNKLLNQLGKTGDMVIYTAVGRIMCAARAKRGNIINSNLYYVPTKSIAESHFLVALLNSNALKSQIDNSKTTIRSFHTELWRKIPMPRYKKSNKWHNELVELSKRAEKFVADQPTTGGIGFVRKSIRDSLVKSKLSLKIDQSVQKIMSSINASKAIEY